MNIEVEIKVEVSDFEDIKNRVARMGKLIKSIRQIDEYYIPCHRDFLRKNLIPSNGSE